MISERTDRTADLPTNRTQRIEAHRALDELLDDAMRRGVTGETALFVHLKDGIIGTFKAKVESSVR